MMAFMRVLAMALALASSTAWTSHPFESARNQYEVREDRPQLPQLLTEDRPEVHSIQTEQKSAIPDLQVGCGDGHIHETLQHPSETDKNKVTSKGRTRSRRRRSYSPWSGQVVYTEPYQSISVWKPPVYQLSRPYYIPIYGASGRPPIFFPPQPLLINPGVPQDNPVKPFQGPPYLPPPKPTTEPTTTMKVGDRFNGGDNDDDRPIWDLGDNEVTQRPTTTTIIPTRRTRPPGVPKTQPPLIHNPIVGQPSQSQNTVDSDFGPPQPQRIPTTSRPALSPPSRPNEPSRCVWAIISCCSTTGEISYDCFEQRGCPGAFWDNNPCDNEFAKAAISAALNYYESK